MAVKIQKVVLCSATGKLGPFLLNALKQQGFEVTVVLRESSKAAFPAEQKIARVPDDYPAAALTAVFSGADAVVLSLSFELLSHSKKFAEASIAAGCRWLIASTYGPNLSDPRCAIFPASIPHRRAVDELMQLQGSAGDHWSWTSIACGPWPELAIAAGAWDIDATAKTARLVDDGQNVFTSSTRKQVALAVAGILDRQPASARNNMVYVSSFEVNMLAWLDAHKQILGGDGWQLSTIGAETLAKQSQEELSAGQFQQAYVHSALAVCTGSGFDNHYSKVAVLINEELSLPKEDLVEVVREGLATPNPFA